MRLDSGSLYRKVLRLRKLQFEIHEEVYHGTTNIPIHFAFGHEAVALAVSVSMQEKDRIFLTHRNIHYHLALGATRQDLINEYKLESSKMSGIGLGSMNLDFPKRGVVYTSNILGNNLSVATGAAYADKLLGKNSMIWCITGDGAIEEGSFYESLILAYATKSPILFIVENNRWSLASEITERRGEIGLEKLASSIGLSYAKLYGNDVTNYSKCLQKIRTSQEPSVIEVELTTLGGYQVKRDENLRYVNYHAGPAKIGTINGHVIEKSDKDPCWVSVNNLKKKKGVL